MSLDASMSAVSLFSGAGGLDLGLHRAGWSPLCQIEMNKECVGTLHAHAYRLRSSTRIIQSPIEVVDPASLRRQLGLKTGQLGMIAGGPPCQPFTTHGLRRGITDARASSAFPHYLRFVAEFMPSALLMENVDGLLSAALRHRPLSQRGKGSPPLDWEEMKGSFLNWLLQELAALGYAVSWGVAEAADYGAPQFRQRAILIGTRDREPCFLPRPTFGPGTGRSYKTLRDAIRGTRLLGPVQPLSEFKRSVYEKIPAGGNWRDLPERLQRETMGAAYLATGGKSGWWRRLSWDQPSPTILGMPDHSSTGLIHPDEVRCLSLNECAAIQTFPPDSQFSGRSRAQYQQVGDAVPPRLGERLGKVIRRHLDGDRPQPPAPPAWRKQSANRRIGTHGWVVPTSRKPQFTLIAKIREDHVWSQRQVELFP